jgi:signal transduction histidine kinase
MNDRRRPSNGALILAAAVVLSALVALVALPLLVSQRATLLRDRMEQRAEPARGDLNEVNVQLSRQIASLSRHVLTGDSEQVENYRRAVAAQNEAMRALAARNPSLGPEYASRLAELDAQSRRWHTVVERYLQSHQTNPAAGNQVTYEANYPDVIEAVYRLDESITAYQAATRAAVRDLTRWQLIISAILMLLGLIAASTVLWMVTRLRALASELASESDQRMASLESERQIRETAQSLLRSRDEILGVVSHDLRSPLTTIMLSTQLIAGSTAEEQSEHVETILTTSRRMQRLIQDLLDATKIENSSLAIRKDPVDCRGIAAEVVASQLPIAARKNVQLQPSIDPALGKICGDHDRIVQALGNIIGNAIKFTPEHGVVRFSAEPHNGLVRFTVSDSGPGISPSDVPHLFEPFWQSKKTAHLGAGLGLKIARAIVEAHGGSIAVSNARDGGACFVLEIPALDQPRPSVRSQ